MIEEPQISSKPSPAKLPHSFQVNWQNFRVALKNLARQWPFLVVLVLYLLLAIAYSQATPMWETPDEPSHFAYSRYIQQNGGPPIQSFQEGKNEVETGHHPPLYYFLGRLLLGNQSLSDFKNLTHNPYFRFGNNDGGVNVFLHTNEATTMPNSVAAGYTLRGLSIGFGAGTLILTYLSGLLIFGKAGAGRRWHWAGNGRAPATLAAVFVGLLPQFGFLSGAINNDNAIIFFCSLTLYACLWLVLVSPITLRWWIFALLGIIVGLGMLAKYNEIAYIPLVALAIGVVAGRARSWRLFLKGGIISGGFCLAVCGWWFVRAQVLYGDPAGWGMWRSSFASVDQSATFKWTGYNLKHIWSRWFDSFWGVFGWMNVPFEPEVYRWPARIMVIAGLGLVLLTLAVIRPNFPRLGRRRRRGKKKIKGTTPFYKNSLRLLSGEIESAAPSYSDKGLGKGKAGIDRTALSLLFLALSFGLVLGSALNYAATFGDAGTQGRYIFPGLTAFALGAAAGLGWLPGLLRFMPARISNRKWPLDKVAGGLVWLMVIAAGVGLGYLNLHALNDRIAPVYSLPSGVSLNSLPPNAIPVKQAEFSSGMDLVGYEIEAPPASPKPGQNVRLKLTLYWQARNNFAENWIGFVHIYAEGRDIGQQDGPPGQGRYQTFFWKKGEIVKDERTIWITDYNWAAAQASNQPLRFQLGWYSGSKRAMLKATGQPDYYFTTPF